MPGMQSRCALPCCHFSYLSEEERAVEWERGSGGQDRDGDCEEEGEKNSRAESTVRGNKRQGGETSVGVEG